MEIGFAWLRTITAYPPVSRKFRFVRSSKRGSTSIAAVNEGERKRLRTNSKQDTKYHDLSLLWRSPSDHARKRRKQIHIYTRTPAVSEPSLSFRHFIVPTPNAPPTGSTRPPAAGIRPGFPLAAIRSSPLSSRPAAALLVHTHTDIIFNAWSRRSVFCTVSGSFTN